MYEVIDMYINTPIINWANYVQSKVKRLTEMTTICGHISEDFLSYFHLIFTDEVQLHSVYAADKLW